MKRLLLWILLSALPAPLALASGNYVNNATVSVVSPPQIAPQIDASNFVNNGIFYITNLLGTGFTPPPPYQSWNTRNWTNSNRMAGDSGFRFDCFDTVGQTNGWSANFQNAGNANPTNASIFGASYVLVAATNISNKGTMMVDAAGLMTLNGKNIDLTRGTLGAVVNDANNLAGVLDLYWGTDISASDGVFYSGTTVQSMGLFATTIVVPLAGSPFYGGFFQSLFFTNPCGTNSVCTNGFTIYATTNQVFLNGTIQSAIDVLFLRQTNPAVATDVRFGNFIGPGVEKIVHWQTLQTNRVSGVVTTNQLFFTDTFGDWFVTNTIAQTPGPNLFGTFFGAARYRPVNYSITHAAPFGYNTLPNLSPTLLNPTVFSGTNFPIFSTNVGWGAAITAAAFRPDPTIQGATWTNGPGRIEITASGANSYLELARTIIDGENYLRLNSTNHFVGSTNAAIISPVSDIYLCSTNGMMSISNLTAPFVPRMEGEIQAYSTRWTNTTAQGVPTLYTVTMVDSTLVEKAPSQVQNLSLRSTNLLISDALNVFGSLLLDTERLTISTNTAHAPTPYGELNLTSGDIWWSPSLPNLQCLTNLGKITSVNSIYFAGARQPPWFTGTFDEPYESFVTHGIILSQGNSTWANYYEASGTNDSGIGPISVQATSAIVTNGAFLATDADIILTSSDLVISNQFLQAGRGITLTVTNYLDDGSLGTSVDYITNKNVWTVGAGISLMLLPTNASLLGTTVTNTAFPNAEVVNYWAGSDRGGWPNGYVNNAALGRLILDGPDAGTLFSFLRTGPTNALYVDLLEFKDFTTNSVSGNVPGSIDFIGVNLDTNFTIYYAQAIVNGQSVAEKLNGGHGVADTNGGRFCWVSNYNIGFWSSTNVVYADGTTNRLNTALVTSCDIDSNGNGIPNCMDTNPIPVLTPASLALTVAITNSPARTAVLSWNTFPLSSNYLYSAPSLLLPSTNWQLVTNFLSDATIGGRVTMTYPITNGGTLYYRVRVLSL
jgi:hypothetical protein